MAVHRYLAEIGLRVLEMGYNVIPISPGGKFPTIPDFLTITTTAPIVKGWIANGHANDGIGITTALTPVVDIDILDEEVSHQMRTFVESLVGYGLVRIGQPPKCGILYRSIKPFKKMSSPIFLDSQGRKAQIEILGDGQQSVAFHIHPETKKPYRWIGKDTPETVPLRDLPVFTEDHGHAIIAEFVRIAEERGWKLKGSTSTAMTRRSAEPAELAELDLGHDPLGLDDDEIHDRLMSIENDDRFAARTDWYRIGMAVAHETGHSEFGREVFHEWSVQHPTHVEAKFDKTWNSFEKHNQERDPITFRYIIHLTPEFTARKNAETAKEIVQRFKNAQSTDELKEIAADAKKTQFLAFDFADIVNALKVAYKRITGNAMGATEAKAAVRFDPGELGTPEWLKGWSYLTTIDRFFNTETKHLLQRIAFDSMFSRCMPPDTLSTASHFALSKALIEVYDNAVYMPAEDEIFKLNGRLCVNKYSDALVPEIPSKLTAHDRENVERVKRHFSHLFADDRDIRMCLSWLAHIVQTRQRPSWALVIQGVEGDGKTFIGELMAAVLGGDNVRMMQAQTLEAPHNAWAEGQLLTFIEEIRLVGHNRHDVLNKIKPLISNSTIEIHPKNINPYNVPNTTAYIASTNFVNALPLTDNDRRYYVLMSQWQDADRLKVFLADHPTYYKDLFDAKDSSPGALRAWLESYELHPEFSAQGRAPYSAGREYMTAMSKPERTTDIEEIIKDSRHADVCADLLIVSSLNNLLGDDDGMILSGPSLRITLQEMGFRYLGRIKIDGSPQAVWTKNSRKWSADPIERNDQIRKYLADAL